MSKEKSDVSMDEIVSLCKRRGFIYQGSEIYGGLAGTWDYGPLGVALKRNIMDLWWKMFVEDRDDMFGVDAAILMNQKVWQASGHVDTFTDPLVECSNCHTRFRADHLIDDFFAHITSDVIIADKDDPALTKKLKDSSSGVRFYAAWVLGKFGSTSEEAIPDLTRLQSDADEGVRQAATRAISNIRRRP